MTRQYYYKVDGCKAFSASDPNCICWHDEGTGPMPYAHGDTFSWRETAPAQTSDPRMELTLKDMIQAGPRQLHVEFGVPLSEPSPYTDTALWLPDDDGLQVTSVPLGVWRKLYAGNPI